MNIFTRHSLAIGLCVLCSASVHAAPQSSVTDTDAARKDKAIREEVEAKKKELFERKDVPGTRQQGGPATAVELPVEQADSPGATTK
jgi:hypothetical protein